MVYLLLGVQVGVWVATLRGFGLLVYLLLGLQGKGFWGLRVVASASLRNFHPKLLLPYNQNQIDTLKPRMGGFKTRGTILGFLSRIRGFRV